MQFANWSPRDVTVSRIRRARSQGREIFDARSRADCRPFGADRGSILALDKGAPTASDASEHPAGVAAIFMLGASEPLPAAAAKSWPDDTAPRAREGARPRLDWPATPDRSATGEEPVPQSHGPSTWRRAIAAAMSRTTTALVDGFALSAAAVHSEFIWLPTAQVGYDDPPEELAREGRAETHKPLALSPPGQSSAWRDVKPDDLARSGSEGTALPSWRVRAASLPAKLWSSVRRRARIRQMRVGWDATDDHTLRDIGVSRYEIDLIFGRERRWY
jgi:uncharacterized protein YjiS (DUF1127 family)